MPGIWGFCRTALDDTDRVIAGRVADRLRHSNLYASRAVARPELAAGAVTLPEVETPVWEDGQGDCPAAVIDGESYDADLRRRELERCGVVFDTTGAAELLAKGWRHSGPAFLRSVEGYFSAALWDEARKSLVLITDRFGMRPLYFKQLEAGFIFASELKALLEFPGVTAKPSLKGVAQFMTFGHLFGNHTLVEDFRCAPAAAMLTFDPRGNTLRQETYHRFAPAPLIRDDREALVQLDEAFARAVARRTTGDLPLGLSLSGGLDARTILAAVARSKIPVTTVSLGIPGCIDHRAATRLAALSHQEHRAYHLDQTFLDRFPQHLERMTFLTDGQYLDQGIGVPTLEIYRQIGIRALLRGHAGELFHMDKAYAFSISPDELDFRTIVAVKAWLWSHLTKYMIDGIGMQLFRRHLRADAEAAARGTLDEALHDIEDIQPPVQALWSLFVSQRLRRETALSMQMFNAYVQVRMPYLDSELIELVMRVRPQLKIGETIQTFILNQRFPEFLRIVNANTGSPVGAGEAARRLSTIKLRVFSKMRVSGYQPYERLGLWLSRDLQPYVRAMLLSPEALDRGLLEPDVVRRVVEDHSSRRRNHTFAVMAMLILELGHRLFADRSPGAPRAMRSGAA
jgi:asparagine synthase (glutamine-hydrolysing)